MFTLSFLIPLPVDEKDEGTEHLLVEPGDEALQTLLALAATDAIGADAVRVVGVAEFAVQVGRGAGSVAVEDGSGKRMTRFYSNVDFGNVN